MPIGQSWLYGLSLALLEAPPGWAKRSTLSPRVGTAKDTFPALLVLGFAENTALPGQFCSQLHDWLFRVESRDGAVV